MTLNYLSRKLGYSEFYISRKFKEISGMQFRDYLRYRRLAFALKEVRDTQNSILDIALNYEETDYCLDFSPGRIFYFYHDPTRYWKYIQPVQKNVK